MLKTIKLLGRLGQRFGREFKMQVSNPAEAIRALCCQLPGFTQALYQSADNGIQYRVVVEDAEGRSEEELVYPLGSRDVIVIAPIASGSGGFGKILLGAALIGAGFAFSGGIFGISSMAIKLMGASMLISGAASLLASTPRTPKNDREKQDSFLFDRAAEVGRQGSPVPVLVGERIVELQIVLSSGLTTNEIPVGA